MSAVGEYREQTSVSVEMVEKEYSDAAIAELEDENAECEEWGRAEARMKEKAEVALAATQKALVIEPGKTYVIEAPDYATTEQIEHLGETWRKMTGSHVVILADGWRITRERVESG